MTVDEAIVKLFSIGVTARLVGDSNSTIFGGKLEDASSIISVFSDAFNIYYDESSWVLVIVGTGQIDMTERLEKLEDAVSRVHEIYQERGIL
jgi:hypothetical protein